MQIVRDVIRHGVMAGRAHRLCEIFFLGKVAKGGFQRFDDSRFKGRLHCPDRQRMGKSGFVRIRHIEVEFQQMLSIVTEHGNAFCTAIDPAAKLPVPAFHFQNGSCVRALGIDQDLLIKRAFVVIAGRTEKACPAFIAAGDASHGLVVQFGDELKFGWQMCCPPFQRYEKSSPYGLLSADDLILRYGSITHHVSASRKSTR
ncbi:hypothetical protein [Butyricicoccus faecihominis]|uniref:hypothetical protein n=1 Tax=Butyricicoccus faecihominis TaxID=1712515 RepID=UPI000E4DA36F|nr:MULTISPECIES: hypothetical protein [Butyricicoccus]RHR86757.1 hypothetical protein DWW41_07590 [Butyricicoccus sp. AF15-40]